MQNLVPAPFLQNGETFDFTDADNAVATQLFTEVVGSLAAAFSGFTNDPTYGNRITNIQRDSVLFARSLSRAVNEAYQWIDDRGITIEKATVLGVEYDEATRELLKVVQRADALTGTRGNANMQASVAAGLETAGGVDGAAGILGLGIAAGSVGVSDLGQPPNAGMAGPGRPGTSEPDPSSAGGAGLVGKLEELKTARDAGLITDDDFDAAKARLLGI